MNKQGPEGIEWTDFTWNPVTGCWGPGGTRENPNRCWYCYAYRIAKQRPDWYSTSLEGEPFEPMTHNRRLHEPCGFKKPSKIFVCSMGDLLGDWVPKGWIDAVLETVRACPQHTFQFLTKNPKRYLEFDWPENCWLGATATNQEQYAKAAFAFEDLLDGPPMHPDNILYISCEPLLSRIDITKYNIIPDWIIIGALAGPKAKQHPVNPEHVNLIKYFQKESFGKPAFLKDNLNWPEKIQEFPK